jgi:predicted NUDIX family phosphoesterase
MNDPEQVLVVQRSIFEQLGRFDGIIPASERYVEQLLSPASLQFIPRPRAEADPSYKQLIPYVLMAHEGRYLSYVRGKRAGEKRLVGLRSIGIGGHINPSDDLPLLATSYREAYCAAVEREVAEEVVVETGHVDRIVALLNDDSTEVGSVHLGVVHLWVLDAPKVRKREQMITELGFLSPAELLAVKDTLESWSRLCLEHIDELATTSGLVMSADEGARARAVRHAP